MHSTYKESTLAHSQAKLALLLLQSAACEQRIDESWQHQTMVLASECLVTRLVRAFTLKQ